MPREDNLTPSHYLQVDFPEQKSYVPKDNVNNPDHYNHNRKGIEAIVAIEASMSADEFLGYLKGNILKYTWRYRYKGGQEDLKKAQWYQKLLITKFAEYETQHERIKDIT